jgi:electron transfer flavoprotein beta subunit
MQIAVCIKSVPDPEYYDKIAIDPVNKTLVREGIPTVINDADKHALEQALQLKEKHGGEITVVSMAPPAARTQLLEALAYGADRAYLLSDRKVGGSDTLATSYVLSQLIKTIGKFDIILTGNESADGATAHVPSQLGEWLGIGHSMNVVAMEMEDDDHALVTKQFENGRGVYRIPLPCVIAVTPRINTVRYINAIAVLKAKNKPFQVWSSDDVVLDEAYIGLEGSPSKSGELETVECTKNCQMLEGDEKEIVTAIFEKIRPALES